LRASFGLDSSIVVPVVKFGGWMTVSNVIGPIMVYLDRFLIGALLSVTAVAYYTAPFDTVTRLLMIPAAAASVLFPAFAVTLLQNSARTELLLKRGTKYVFLAVFPVVLAIVVFAPEGLRVWLGPSFAENGGTVLRWLAAGVFVNSLAHAPFALIQGAGRPDVTAKMHLLELPLYLAALWLLTARLGIRGAAIAWTGRNTLDACLIWFFAQRQLPRGSKFLVKLAAIAGTGLLVFYAGTLAANIYVRAGFLVVSLLLFLAVSWTRLLVPEERALLLRRGRAMAPAISGFEDPQR
jgi:O-antigen/teichoic acid export membrane protein